jgi:peroxiredoxin
LLSDVDRAVGTSYEVTRDAGDPYAPYARRLAYLIDPDGVIRKSYDVTDVAGYAAQVVADVEALSGDG